MTSFSFTNWLTIHLLPPSTIPHRFALVIEVSRRHVRHNRGVDTVLVLWDQRSARTYLAATVRYM